MSIFHPSSCVDVVQSNDAVNRGLIDDTLGISDHGQATRHNPDNTKDTALWLSGLFEEMVHDCHTAWSARSQGGVKVPFHQPSTSTRRFGEQVRLRISDRT